MHDNFFHSFFQVMTGTLGGQTSLGSLRWFVLVMAWVLFVGGIAIAYRVWSKYPEQRTVHHVSVFALRFVMAGMWYEGSLWKLPWPISGAFKFWLASTVKYNSFRFLADFMQIFLNHIAIIQPLIYLLEVFFAASLAFGFAVRFSGILASLFVFNLLIALYNDPTEWAWTYIGIVTAHAMFSIDGAGRSLGLDYLWRREPIFPLNSAPARLYSWVS